MSGETTFRITDTPFVGWVGTKHHNGWCVDAMYGTEDEVRHWMNLQVKADQLLQKLPSVWCDEKYQLVKKGEA
jgi:hypothetical protein